MMKDTSNGVDCYAADRGCLRADIEALKANGIESPYPPALVAWAYSDFPGPKVCGLLMTALKKIPARTNSGGDDYVCKTALELMRIASGPPLDAAIHRHLRPASLKATKKELAELAKAAEKLTEAIDKLRRPSIAALEAVGFAHLTHINMTWKFAAGMGSCAKRAMREAKWDGSGKGQPPNVVALAIAQQTVKAYAQLTGKNPAVSQSSEGLAAALDEIFKIFGIDANAKAALASVVD